MKITTINFLLVFVLCSTNLLAQNIIGTWQGDAYLNTHFKFAIKIETQSYGNISGTTYIEELGKNGGFGMKGDYGIFHFTGKIINNRVYFKEKMLLEDYKTGNSWFWCFKQGNLELKQVKGTWYLTGYANYCNQVGQISVKKVSQ